MKLVLLTQDACTLCDHAKEVLDRVRTDHAFDLQIHDLSSSEGREVAASAGVLFPPGVLINGEAFSFGRLSERKLRRELVRRSREAVT